MGSLEESALIIRAAGVVVLRHHDAITEALVVHRPRYDDWSLPKGKVEANEHPAVTAVRECDEETGHHVRLGPPLNEITYLDGGRLKTVQYWVATSLHDEGFTPDDEVDQIAWCPVEEVHQLLDYPGDIGVVQQARKLPPTVPLVVLRHARAMKRADFKGKADAERPLSGTGRSQAKALIPLLDAYGIDSVVTSDAERCYQTVRRYAKSIDVLPLLDQAFSEEGHDVDPELTAARAGELAGMPAPTVLCTHRPVLPTVMTAIAGELQADPGGREWEPRLRPGGCLVIHRALPEDGSHLCISMERHEPFAE